MNDAIKTLLGTLELDPFCMAPGASNLVNLPRATVFLWLSAWALRRWDMQLVFPHAMQIIVLLKGPELARMTTVRAVHNWFFRTIAEKHLKRSVGAAIVGALLSDIAAGVGGQLNFPVHWQPLLS